MKPMDYGFHPVLKGKLFLNYKLNDVKIKSYLTVYEESHIDDTSIRQLKKELKKNKVVVKKEPLILDGNFITIPDCSCYQINEKGVVVSRRTSKTKILFPVKKTDNCSYVTIRNDKNIVVKVHVEKMVKHLFNFPAFTG